MNEQKLPEHYRYWKGYIYMPIELAHADRLPQAVTVEGKQLEKKKEFHVTLLDMHQFFPQGGELEFQECMQKFITYAKLHPIKFLRLKNELRHAIRSEEETVVCCCEVSGLEGLFEFLNREYENSVPTQAAHVTLYMYKTDIGIGISSAEQMNSYEKVDLPEITTVLGMV